MEQILNQQIVLIALQALVYCDPLIQNNLPIFISQLRALYPNKENEDKYTELVALLIFA